jgi:hypothetical protein
MYKHIYICIIGRLTDEVTTLGAQLHTPGGDFAFPLSTVKHIMMMMIIIMMIMMIIIMMMMIMMIVFYIQIVFLAFE